MTAQPDLFSPIQLGAYTLPNRIVMAPLTRNRAGAGNVPHELNVLYYEQRASAGLIITEATQISPQGMGYFATPGIHSAEQIEGWRKITSAVHAKGGRSFLQLWHVGRISHPALQPDSALPVAPSAIAPEGNALTYEGPQPFVTPRALETDEIPGIVEQYRQAAKNAMNAGFDGVEIHNANGYLLDQFLRDGTNHRTDDYGGSIENRARLPLAVVQAVVDVWGSDRVGIRISPSSTFNSMSDSNPEATFGYFVEKLNDFNLAYLHMLEPTDADSRHGGTAVASSFFRPIYKGNLMVNAGYTKETGNAAIASGTADLVSYGTLYIANPDLVERFEQDAPLNEPDSSTFYGGSEKGYTDYPALQPQVA